MTETERDNSLINTAYVAKKKKFFFFKSTRMKKKEINFQLLAQHFP